MTVHQLHSAYRHIWALANHHKKILKRRFPNYVVSISVREPLSGVLYPPFVSVETDEPSIGIFSAAFQPSSVTISIHTQYAPGSQTLITSLDREETIYYADPKLTDDILSEIIEEFEHRQQKYFKHRQQKV